ncbi:N-terminal glutamine amidase-domain-containing protein [Chytriomyces sp. MP71]|nr:N-terminal glutamine amidase-domain-containing protein [Chytriomyces sp. MP71]
MNKEDFIHTPCYCEENVLLLLKHLLSSEMYAPQIASLHAVFISNPTKSVPIWHQTRGNPVVWDYHVFAMGSLSLADGKSQRLVLDLDSTLPFPTTLSSYLQLALPRIQAQDPGTDVSRFHRFYRVVPAAEFMATFASDRRHMRRSDPEFAELIQWNAAPPDYPPFKTDTSDFNLDMYWTMGSEYVGIDGPFGLGRVYDEDVFREAFYDS